MFYCPQILQKRKVFGLVWLAALRNKDLTKKDYLSVDLARTVDDIRDYVTLRMIENGRVSRLSLYTSSHLMYGSVVVLRRKQHYLIEDLSNLMKKIRRGETDELQGGSPTKLRKPGSKTTKTQINFELPPFDIGFNRSLPDISIAEIPVWPSDNVISTPPSHRHEPGYLQSPPELITIPPPVSRRSLIPDFDDLPTGNIDVPSFGSSAPPTDTSTLPQDESPLRPAHTTPAPIPQASAPPGLLRKRSTLPEPAETPRHSFDTSAVSHDEPSLRQMSTSISSGNLSLASIPPGALPARRRRRRHGNHLLVDDGTKLTHDQMRTNQQDTSPIVARDRGSRRVDIHRQTPPEELFVRPGLSGMKSKNLLNHFTDGAQLVKRQRIDSDVSPLSSAHSSFHGVAPDDAPIPGVVPLPDDFLSDAASPRMTTPQEVPRPVSTSFGAPDNISATRISTPSSTDKSSSAPSTPSFRDVSSSSISAIASVSHDQTMRLSPIEELEELIGDVRRHSAGGTRETSFFKICPPGVKSRRTAGCKFNTLLFGTSVGRLEIQQDIPYDDITIRVVRGG